MLGAGPYNRTAGPVMEACLAAKVPYLDFDDDIESTLHALSLHEDAGTAGVPFYVGCGASPGITNVMVADAAGELDSVENIDVYWVVGDERGSIGRAVLDHMLRLTAGPCMTWQNGGPVMHQSWLETRWTEMGGGLGLTMVHETAHPEPVTLPRKYPDAKNIRCFGGLDPAPYNGLVRGVGLAVQKGEMPMETAIDFLEALLTNKFGSVKGWRHALSGMRNLVRTGEATRTELIKFLALAAVGHTFPYKSGLKVEVTGLRNGIPTVVTRRTPVSGPGTYLFADMAAVTGTACAAFMVVALDDGPEARAGCSRPKNGPSRSGSTRHSNVSAPRATKSSTPRSRCHQASTQRLTMDLKTALFALADIFMIFAGLTYGWKFIRDYKNYLLGLEWIIVGSSGTNFLAWGSSAARKPVRCTTWLSSWTRSPGRSESL